MTRLKEVRPRPIERNGKYYWFVIGYPVFVNLSTGNPSQKRKILEQCFLNAVDVNFVDSKWFWVIED